MLNLIKKGLQNKFLQQSIVTFGLRGMGVAFLFAITILMTRSFAPEAVGQYEFIRIFLLILGSVSLVGTDVSIIYFAGKLRANNSFSTLKNTYYSMTKMVLCIAVAINLVFFIFIKEESVNLYFQQDVYSIIQKAVFFLPFYIITLLNTETLRALERPVLSELFRNIFKYCPLAVGLIVALTTDLSYSIAEYYIYGFLFLFLVSQWSIWYCFRRVDYHDHANLIFSNKEIIKHSLPMGISSIVLFLFMGVDVFLLKKYYDDDWIAYYAVAIKLITILSMVILSININCSPRISELFSMSDKKNLQLLCKKTANFTFKANVVVGLFLIVFIKAILTFFGEQYVVIQDTFYILIVSQLVTSAFGVVPVYLNMTGRSLVFQFILIITLIINVIMNIILIPLYGTIGAAITFTFSVVFWNLIVFIYVYRKDGINLFFLSA